MFQRRTLIIAGLVIVAAVSGFLFYRMYGSGTLLVKVTDPPMGWDMASDVYLHLEDIEIHRADAGNTSGWIQVVEETGWIDLKETLNTSETLGSQSLRASRYNLLRFNVSEAIVTIDDVNHTAPVESGFLTTAITQGGVTIETGQTSTVTIDITPKVVPQGEQGYKIVPAAQATPS